MTKKVKELLDRVNGIDCKDVLIQIVAEDKSRSNDFHLKEVMQIMTKKQCEQFWSCIYQTIELIENEADLTNTGVNAFAKTEYTEKDLYFFEAIHHIVSEMLNNEVVWCESVYSSLRYIHSHFFLLSEELQESFCRIFETMWTKELDFRDNYAPNMCQYLLHKALQLTKQFSGYMKRINAIRDGFKLIDYSNKQSEVLKSFIIECFSIPNIVANPNGKRILSLFFTLTPEFPRECFKSLQSCILTQSNSVVRAWGDIIISSDLACEDEEIRNVLEQDVIQEIMRIAIHAANQHVFITTKTILATFVHCRNHKELWSRLTELYEPLLFRSLSATNSLVRRHAVIIFTDCFPLGTSETRDTYSIEEQFKALLVLCDDECPSVRSVAVAGVLHLIRNYFELLPVSVTTVILDHFTQHLIYDQRLEVREFCFKGIIEMLDNRLVYSLLFPRIKKLWGFIFDKKIRIRRLFLQMLIRLQNIKSFDMASFFSLSDFLTMFLYDYYTSPANPIIKLYLKYLYPLFWKEQNEYKFVTRVHNFLLSNPDACFVFFKECIHSADVNDCVKLIMVLLKSLFLCYDGALNQNDQPATKTTKTSKKGRKRDADEMSTDQTDNKESFENSSIPTDSTAFQKNLFHLIVLMMKALQACCTKEELKNSYEYIVDVIDGKQLLALHDHTVQSQSEDDFLSFLSYFDYAVIDQIRPNFIAVVLSSSQAYLTHQLPLFMQLVYQWNIGDKMMETALNQIKQALSHPEDTFGSEEEQLIKVSMPIKKQRTTKAKKKQAIPSAEVEISLSQSIALLRAIVNDSIHQSTAYAPEVLASIHAVLKEVLPSFQQYMFPPAEHYYERRPQLATNFYFEMVSLLLKEELFQVGQDTVKSIKENFIQDGTDCSTPRDDDETPSFYGPIPSSMSQLLSILRETQLNLNPTGNYILSITHLLLLYSQKAMNLLLWNEQYADDFVSYLRKLLTCVFLSDLQETKQTSEVYEVDHAVEETMKQYTTEHILPAFGKWLQQIHTLCCTTPGCNTEFPSTLVFEVINSFPRCCLPYYENELIPLLKAYPSQLETHIQMIVQRLIANYTDFRDYPSLENLKAVYKQRTGEPVTFLLSRICKNYLVMKLIADSIHARLSTEHLLETFGMLCVFLNCMEVRSVNKLKIPATLYTPIQRYIDNFNEKYRQTLTAQEANEAKKSLQFIIKTAEEIVHLANQEKKEKQTPAVLARIDEESEYEESALKEIPEEVEEPEEEIAIPESPIQAVEEEEILIPDEAAIPESPVKAMEEAIRIPQSPIQQKEEEEISMHDEPQSPIQTIEEELEEEKQPEIAQNEMEEVLPEEEKSDSFFDEPEY